MKNKKRGWKAQNNGAKFEDLFEAMCHLQRVQCVPIHDGCRQIGRRLQRVKQPFDYVICFNQRAAFIDTKSTEKENFVHSKIVPHQLRSLLRLSPGGRSGYVIALKEDVYFVDVSILKETKPGESVNLSRAMLLGTRRGFDLQKIFN